MRLFDSKAAHQDRLPAILIEPRSVKGFENVGHQMLGPRPVSVLDIARPGTSLPGLVELNQVRLYTKEDLGKFVVGIHDGVDDRELFLTPSDNPAFEFAWNGLASGCTVAESYRLFDSMEAAIDAARRIRCVAATIYGVGHDAMFGICLCPVRRFHRS